MGMMKAVVFNGNGRLAVEEVRRPTPAAGEALIRITATTICGTECTHRPGRISGQAGVDPRPRAGRHRRGTRPGPRT
jgi:threonine dehydrogenase-like Zn-dependent dehydrogenase